MDLRKSCRDEGKEEKQTCRESIPKTCYEMQGAPPWHGGWMVGEALRHSSDFLEGLKLPRVPGGWWPSAEEG